MADNARAGRDAFFDDLVRVETRLYNALNDRLREANGIVASQFELLRFIGAGEGVRVGDIAQAFAVGVGATSKGVDRLEAAGWVARLPNPANRRSSLLRLSTAGERLVQSAAGTWARELSALLGTADLSAAAPLLATLRVRLENARVGLPAG